MSDVWTFRQHEEEPETCIEEGCARPAYDRVRCKLHADLATYREMTGDQTRERRDAPPKVWDKDRHR